MPAKQPHHLRVTRDHCGERGGLFGPSIAANVVVVDVERRMVNEQQGRSLGLRAQDGVEPGLARRAKNALAFTG